MCCPMNLKFYLDSKAIFAVEYEPWTGIMLIWFTSKSKDYSFRGVLTGVFQGLVESDSPGTFYNIHIRGRFR